MWCIWKERSIFFKNIQLPESLICGHIQSTELCIWYLVLNWELLTWVPISITHSIMIILIMLCKGEHCKWITKDIILSRGNHFLIFDVQKNIPQIRNSKLMFCLKNSCLTKFIIFCITNTSQANRKFR